MKNKAISLFEIEPSDFKRMVLKSLNSRAITGDEAKVLIRDGQKEFGIFLFEDDLTDADYHKKSGLEKLGFYGGVIVEGTEKNF